MGLCKCPKKKVTNQFCFEHRVNVCEHCLVSGHSRVSFTEKERVYFYFFLNIYKELTK